MKKYLALLCAAVLSVSVLTGCGSKSEVVEEEEVNMELSLWCCSDCPTAEAFAVLAESYTRVRPSTKINVTVFEAEDELLSAAEDKLPDMVLCSHTAASELTEKDQLWDCSTLFGGISPRIVPIYGKGCIGKSFFPLCYDADVLCVSAAYTGSRTELSDLDGLFASAEQYTEENSSPFICFDSFAGLFNSAAAQFSHRFYGVRDRDVESTGFVRAYNAIAECYVQSGFVFTEDSLEAVEKGEAVCGFVSSHRLTEHDGLDILPACTVSGGSSVFSAVAYGVSITSDDNETSSRLFDFMRWAYKADNSVPLSLSCGCVPAVTGLDIAADTPLETVLKELYDGYSAALIGYTREDHVNQLSFDGQCLKALEILGG